MYLEIIVLVLDQGGRIPGSGGARAPPVFKIIKTLSHKNAIKPQKILFIGVCAPPDIPGTPSFQETATALILDMYVDCTYSKYLLHFYTKFGKA